MSGILLSSDYRRRGKELFPLLVRSIVNQTEGRLRKSKDLTLAAKKAKRVDVGELVRTDKRKILFTPGLATCTGVIAYSQNNDFAYMAQLSPVDDCYKRPRTATALPGDKKTDLISPMMRRIRFIGIKPYQIDELRFLREEHSPGLFWEFIEIERPCDAPFTTSKKTVESSRKCKAKNDLSC